MPKLVLTFCFPQKQAQQEIPWPLHTFLLTKENITCFSNREPEACLETMSAITKVMAGVRSPRHSPPSDLCTSISLATTRETPSLHLMRSWWTPPSLPAATHLQAPMQTSTMPTTLPCAASQAHPATPALSAQWKAMGLHCRPPYVCKKLLGNYHPKGKLHSTEWANGPGGATSMPTPKHCCLARVTLPIALPTSWIEPSGFSTCAKAHGVTDTHPLTAAKQQQPH